MKKTKVSLALISSLLLGAIAINMTGCATVVHGVDLMDGITPANVTAADDLDKNSADVADFALRLFKAANAGGENTLISPLSVLCALAMTANGANGQTREQMEAVLGMSVEELNIYLYSYMSALSEDELRLANSIWFTDDERFTVNRDFLQTNADYYGAGAYKVPFDKQTLKDINNWVKDKTDGMIPEILDDIPDEAVMYLVNALAFESEWSEIYRENQVRVGQFIKEDGTVVEVDMMYGKDGEYLDDGRATGFIKQYSGGKYAFAALLPNEGISVSEYVNSLDGATLCALLASAKSTEVNTAIPKFDVEYDTEMSDVLKTMGMTDAFDFERADFSNLGRSTEGNICINRVIHKTYIQVGEKGTKAGAASVVEMVNKMSFRPDDAKQVYLNRPFVYMIIDCENDLPLFIGTAMDVTK